jgi:hypothetical protein
MRRVIYYAHPMNLYGTPQEERDIALLVSLGFEVLNPADPEYTLEAEQYRNKMAYFKTLVSQCDALAFRACPDGRITCGVAQEIDEMLGLGLPVFELPRSIKARTMTIPQTLEYLTEIGER